MKKLILLSLLLISCSTTKNKQSKSEKSETKTEIVATDKSTIKTDAETNTKTITEIVTDSSTNEVTETTTIEPIDNTKPATFTNESGAVVNLNNSKVVKSKTTRKSDEKQKASTNIDKGEKVAQIEENEGKTEYVNETQSESNETDLNKKATSLLGQYYWLWLLILLLVVVGWWKRKDLFKKDTNDNENN